MPNNIPIKDRDFFTLLRTALWQKAEATLSPSPDWHYIYQLSCDQTVTGVIADGITLYHSAHPEFEIPDEWQKVFFSVSLQIICSNNAINSLQAKICHLLHEEEIKYIVMKGQAVAQCYPKPLLRNAGDIDLYVDYDNYKRARHCLETLADRTTPEDPTEKHIGFIFDGIEVELHSDDAYSIGGQRLFNSLLTETLHSNQLRSYDCNGVKINTAPATFDILYSFLHSNKHYINNAIGIRQFCDLAMLLHSYHNELDFQYLQKNLKQFHASHRWKLFISFLHIYLGLPIEETHLTKRNLYITSCHKIWKICRTNGNFGRGSLRPEKKHYNNFLLRNIIGFHRSHKAVWHSFSFNPPIAIKRALNLYRMYIAIAYRKIFHIGGDKFNV